MITNTKIGTTNIKLNNSYKLGNKQKQTIELLKTRTTQINTFLRATNLFNTTS